MTLKSITISGKPGTDIKSELFDMTSGNQVVAQAVRVYLANQRQGTAKVKNRGEVDLTKKKWYRQKGTGGARHGARSAPIFVGGGVTHGPTGTTDWSLKISKPMRKVAIKTALAMQAGRERVSVIEGLEKIGAKTREVAKMLENVGATNVKTLIVANVTHPDFIRASRNIATVLCSRVDRLNAYEVMSAHKILITDDAIKALEVKLGKKSMEAKMQEISGPVDQKRTKKVAEKKVVIAKKTVVKKTTKKVADK